jgi:hypothetical protein
MEYYLARVTELVTGEQLELELRISPYADMVAILHKRLKEHYLEHHPTEKEITDSRIHTYYQLSEFRKQPRCPGCRYNSPGQKAHMEPDGCLYSGAL